MITLRRWKAGDQNFAKRVLSPLHNGVYISRIGVKNYTWFGNPRRLNNRTYLTKSHSFLRILATRSMGLETITEYKSVFTVNDFHKSTKHWMSNRGVT